MPARPDNCTPSKSSLRMILTVPAIASEPYMGAPPIAMVSTRSTRPAGIRLRSTCEPAEELPTDAAELADTKRRPLTNVNVRCRPIMHILMKRKREARVRDEGGNQGENEGVAN